MWKMLCYETNIFFFSILITDVMVISLNGIPNRVP